jgi:hypothetical protein
VASSRGPRVLRYTRARALPVGSWQLAVGSRFTSRCSSRYPWDPLTPPVPLPQPGPLPLSRRTTTFQIQKGAFATLSRASRSRWPSWEGRVGASWVPRRMRDLRSAGRAAPAQLENGSVRGGRRRRTGESRADFTRRSAIIGSLAVRRPCLAPSPSPALRSNAGIATYIDRIAEIILLSDI